MIHLPELIIDLALILIIAAPATLVFKRLKQPLVLGYLVTGILVGPHVPFFHTVVDQKNLQVWSELGVIFLLFSIGLEFSFKKLIKIGGSASFTALFEVLFMILFGYVVGKQLEWSFTDSLFLGAILSMSSTTIIAKTFQELKLRSKKYVDFVFGVLIVEDVTAIFLLVLLTAISTSPLISFFDLGMSAFKLLFYIALWFLLGIFFIPYVLRKIRPLLDPETTLLVSMGGCFLMVLIAANTGFSPALGAFLIGSLLAETPEGHKMEELLQPIKNLFAAVFFISVGMLINPHVIFNQGPLIALTVLITIVGKFLSTFLGALISGQDREKSFMAGMSLAQIGEFSFLIAALGNQLNVISDFMYPLAISVSVVTTFTTPYLIRGSENLWPYFENNLPQRWKKIMDRYHWTLSNRENKSQLAPLVLHLYGFPIIINTVLIFATYSVFKNLPSMNFFNSVTPKIQGAMSLTLTLIASGPFFWGLLLGPPRKIKNQVPQTLMKLRTLQVSLFLIRYTLACSLILLMIHHFIPSQKGVLLVVLLPLSIPLFSQHWMKKLYHLIESQFLKNLNERERQALEKMEPFFQILPWQIQLGRFEIGKNSPFIGKKLLDLNFREKFNLTIVAVDRGTTSFFAPDGNFQLWPLDTIYCCGNEKALEEFTINIDTQEEKEFISSQLNSTRNHYHIKSILITRESELKSKTIAESDLRTHPQGGLVVAVERGEEKILGPAGHFLLKENDLLWIVGFKD